MSDFQDQDADGDALSALAHHELLLQQAALEEASYCHAVSLISAWLHERHKADGDTISRLLLRLADLEQVSTYQQHH